MHMLYLKRFYLKRFCRYPHVNGTGQDGAEVQSFKNNKLCFLGLGVCVSARTFSFSCAKSKSKSRQHFLGLWTLRMPLYHWIQLQYNSIANLGDSNLWLWIHKNTNAHPQPTSFFIQLGSQLKQQVLSTYGTATSFSMMGLLYYIQQTIQSVLCEQKKQGRHLSGI